MIETLRNIFYGENWIIAWALIALPFLIAAALSIPGLIKSMKQQKKSSKKSNKLFTSGDRDDR